MREEYKMMDEIKKASRILLFTFPHNTEEPQQVAIHELPKEKEELKRITISLYIKCCPCSKHCAAQRQRL